MKSKKLDLSQIKFYVNTDTVDIENKQIGVSYQGTVAREFCLGVNHKGTRESVSEATRIARLLASSPEMLAELKHLGRILEAALNNGVQIPGLATVNKLTSIVNKIEKE